MDRRLIINADDLGRSTQRSHGIFQCVEFGAVTSVTILPNASDSDRAAKHAREKGIPAGLHINLSEEYPLSKPEDVPGLIQANGQFPERLKAYEALETRAVPKVSLEREIRRQVEWFFDNYGQPTHIDGHQHIHVFPMVIEVLVPLLERYGVNNVRIPLELPLPPFGFEIAPEQLAFVETLNARASAARELYTAHGMRTTDHFRGATLLGNASARNVRHILSRLPEGTTELMVHPGSPCTYGTSFDLDPQRQTELRMLLDPALKEELAKRKVQLISWADL